MDERIATACMCKGVSAVIPNAPLVITEEFIKKNNIHIVGCSAEYDSPEDEYYTVPRQMGILKVIPRITGISTSELMKRVINRNEATNTVGQQRLGNSKNYVLEKSQGHLNLRTTFDGHCKDKSPWGESKIN
jgi:hypothetical protein